MQISPTCSMISTGVQRVDSLCYLPSPCHPSYAVINSVINIPADRSHAAISDTITGAVSGLSMHNCGRATKWAYSYKLSNQRITWLNDISERHGGIYVLDVHLRTCMIRQWLQKYEISACTGDGYQSQGTFGHYLSANDCET